jgi:hypothetical protein
VRTKRIGIPIKAAASSGSVTGYFFRIASLRSGISETPDVLRVAIVGFVGENLLGGFEA